MMNRTSIVTIIAGAAEIAAPVFAGEPQFKSTGTPPPGPCGSFSWILPTVCSDTGELGGANCGGGVLWNPETGFQLLKPSKEGQHAYVTDFITHKSIPVGTAMYNDWPRPVMWPDRNGPPVPIPGFPVDQWYAGSPSIFANYDGTMVVGNMYHKTLKNVYGIFIWRAGVRKNQGWEFITQFPPGKELVEFVDLSDHSNIGVGESRSFADSFEAMRWSKATGFMFDGDLPGGDVASVYGATNAVGTVAVGEGAPSSPNYAAVRWTARSGMVRLDESAPPPLTGLSTGFGDTDDSGFVHVGGVSQVAVDGALLWNPLDGMIAAKDLLVNTYGLTGPIGWNLLNVEVISPNGRYIAGRGLNPQGVLETWWAEIRPFCYADCDRGSTPKGGEPVLNIDDFICYMTHFVMDDLYANCNNDAEINIDDFICFQTAFSLGC